MRGSRAIGPSRNASHSLALGGFADTFKLIEGRRRHRPTIITTNLDSPEWQTFLGTAVVEALLTRLSASVTPSASRRRLCHWHSRVSRACLELPNRRSERRSAP